MKRRKPEVVDRLGARKSNLGAVELVIEDVRGVIHTFILLPSRVGPAIEFLQQFAERVPARKLSAVESTRNFEGSRRLLEKLSAASRAQSGGYAVWVDRDEQAIVLSVRAMDGECADAILDVESARRMIERLQTAVATIESASAPKQ